MWDVVCAGHLGFREFNGFYPDFNFGNCIFRNLPSFDSFLADLGANELIKNFFFRHTF